MNPKLDRLHVEPLYHPLDMKKIPADGNEYLHQVRVERKCLVSDLNDDPECIPYFEPLFEKGLDEIPLQVGSFEWRQRESKNFCKLALKLKEEKQLLEKKFLRHPYSVDDEKDFCLFALGSELYKKVYEKENVIYAEGHPPLLSIILHFTQDDIALALKYTRKWYTRIGVFHEITRWVYALLAIFCKPLSRENEEFLEDFFDELEQRITLLSGEQRNQLCLIGGILLNYFCVKAYLFGTPTERYLNISFDSASS